MDGMTETQRRAEESSGKREKYMKKKIKKRGKKGKEETVERGRAGAQCSSAGQ